MWYSQTPDDEFHIKCLTMQEIEEWLGRQVHFHDEKAFDEESVSDETVGNPLSRLSEPVWQN